MRSTQSGALSEALSHRAPLSLYYDYSAQFLHEWVVALSAQMHGWQLGIFTLLGQHYHAWLLGLLFVVMFSILTWGGCRHTTTDWGSKATPDLGRWCDSFYCRRYLCGGSSRIAAARIIRGRRYRLSRRRGHRPRASVRFLSWLKAAVLTLVKLMCVSPSALLKMCREVACYAGDSKGILPAQCEGNFFQGGSGLRGGGRDQDLLQGLQK